MTVETTITCDAQLEDCDGSIDLQTTIRVPYVTEDGKMDADRYDMCSACAAIMVAEYFTDDS